MDDFRLRKEQFLAVFREAVEQPALASCREAIRPRAIFLGGQPGCGKSTLAKSCDADFGPEGFIHVDVDRVRGLHPAYLPLVSNPLTESMAPSAVQKDCSQWVDMLAMSAVGGRRNLLVDGTMRVPDQVRATASAMRAAGYVLEARIMAVHEKASEVSLLQRFEHEKQRVGFGRTIPADYHAKAAAGILDTVRAIEADKLFDRLVIVDRAGAVVYENELVAGEWVRAPHGAEAMDAYRRDSYDLPAKRKIAGLWDDVVAMMKARGAGEAELLPVLELRRSAKLMAGIGDVKSATSRGRDMGTRAGWAGQLELFGADSEVAVSSAAMARGTAAVIQGIAGEVVRELSAEAVTPSNLPSTVPLAVMGEKELRPVSGIAVGAKTIEDAGEELVYNRRNRVRSGKRWADIAGLNDALKVKEAVKGSLWPKPDYKQLIAGGMKPLVAHVVKQIYDGVAVKPVIGGGKLLDDAALQCYCGALERIEAGVMQWAQDPVAVARWAESIGRRAGAMLDGMQGRRVAVSSLIEDSKTLLEVIYPEGWKAFQDEVRIVGGNKLLGVLQPGTEEAVRALKAIEKGWPEKREAWEVQGFRVVENPAVEVHENPHRAGSFVFGVAGKYVCSFGSRLEADAAVEGVKPFVLFGKRGMVGSFATKEEAVESAKERTRRDKGNVIGEKGVRVEAVERVGAARRLEGEDISSGRLVEEFGFRGVNLGNWMKTPSARAEAQLHLNHAFDSAHDLAEILGVPPKAISLNGMLGLAIGAQGNGGGTAAHFVPGVNEINITRTSGAGSLAHEWGHALDHYFAAQAGLATAAEPFLTEHASFKTTRSVFQTVDGKQVPVEVALFGDLRPEVVAAFSSIVDVMGKRMQSEDEAKAALVDRVGNAKKAMGKWLAAIRRDFSGQEAAFDVLADRARAGDFGDGQIAVSRSTYLSPLVVEMRELYKEKNGRAYSLENAKGLQSCINSYEFWAAKDLSEEVHVPQKVTSVFSQNALSLDKAKGGKPYWSTRVEKFARAFDAFVSDELEARLAKNNYLSHTGRADDTVPMGEERVAINGAFRSLIDIVESRETERGVALASIAAVEPAEVKASLSVDAIALEVTRKRSKWPGMPRVTVVKRVADLPFKMKKNTDGAFGDGQVYLVAENIFDLKQVQKVMAHECVLHYGLEAMLGDYGFSKLHTGIQGLKKAGDPVVCRLAANILERYGRLPPISETREIVARAGEECLDSAGNVKVEYGFMKSVFAGVAGWLRDKGFEIPFTNTELQGIIHDAGKWIERDREQEWRGGGIRVKEAVNSLFGGAEVAMTPMAKGQVSIKVDGVVRPAQNSKGQPIHWSEEGTRNFWRGFGDSKAVDGEGRPLVVFHGTGLSINKFMNTRGAIYFSPEVAFAEDFAHASAEDQREMGNYEDEFGLASQDGGEVIYPVYLTAKNVFDPRNSEHVKKLVEATYPAHGALRDIWTKRLSAGMYDDLESHYAEMQELGFDGFFEKESAGQAFWNIGVFDPEQIKSATGNFGTFDHCSADIVCSLANGHPGGAGEVKNRGMERSPNLGR